MENFKITDRTYRFWILKVTLFLADISNLVKLLSFFDPQKPWKYKQIWGLRSLSLAKTTKTVQFQQWQEVLRHSFVFNQKPIVDSKICSWGGNPRMLLGHPENFPCLKKMVALVLRPSVIPSVDLSCHFGVIHRSVIKFLIGNFIVVLIYCWASWPGII